MSALFSPLTLRGLTLKNRISISPMCQHSAENSHAGAWHMVHLGRFAMGGAGLIIVESTAVASEARIGVRDLGLWQDSQIAPLRAITDFAHSQGAAIAVQLAHAGRKAGSHALWDGGAAFSPAENASAAPPLHRIGPSPIAAGAEWSLPEVVDSAMMDRVVGEFVTAAHRADQAGFDVVELHFGHGYLAASFLSPVSNRREDEFGGSIENRMRFPLRIAQAVRAAWPEAKPLFVRVSAVDGAEGGWSLDDSVIFAKALKALGVDLIDCSSGGLSEQTKAANVPRGLGFQVPFAAKIRAEAEIATQAVGVIVDPHQAEAVLARGEADLIAIGRQALFEPNWANHAALALKGETEGYAHWPIEHGSWLSKRAPMLRKLLEENAGF